MSIPDTALLVPLAELLDVTVTELLMCKRMEQPCTVAPEQVETLVKTAIAFSDEKPVRAYQVQNKWALPYIISLFIGGISIFVSHQKGAYIESVDILLILSVIFGMYFCFFVQTRLPRYYDENRICSYSDGIFRMNMAGLAFNNQNWPHIVRVCRIWSCFSMSFLPLLSLLMQSLQVPWWQGVGQFVILFFMLGMFILPVYIVGKKYGSR